MSASGLDGLGFCQLADQALDLAIAGAGV